MKTPWHSKAAESPKPDTPPPSEPKPGMVRQALSTIAALAVALLVALLLINFVFQSFQVSGQSMQNTLQDQDRLLVWKLPRTWARITGHQYVPKRGDIVIVNQGNLTACLQTGEKQIVKRVIGLPGDRVVYHDAKYTVYDKAHPKGFDPDTTLPYGKAGTALFSDDNGRTSDVTLGSNQLYISGDHRNNSCDSRYFGPITTDQVVGKLAARILPLSDAQKF